MIINTESNKKIAKYYKGNEISNSLKSMIHVETIYKIQLPDKVWDLIKQFMIWDKEYYKLLMESKDGYIMTNRHVIKNSDEIKITLSNQTQLKATLIGTDERSDLALLKVDAENLPVVSIGTSENLKVGEWVLAIGSPFGFDHTVTAGIVSGKKRNLPNESYVPYIQTDVAINPGNSGGPLFNLNGEVVGVNAQIYTRSGGFMGVSFAIPAETLSNVYRQLKEEGKVKRGWLGVFIQEVDQDLAESFGLKKPEGAVIAKILNNSPAEKIWTKAG